MYRVHPKLLATVSHKASNCSFALMILIDTAAVVLLLLVEPKDNLTTVIRESAITKSVYGISIMAAGRNDDCYARHRHDVSVIKYYLDEFEKADIKRYTADYTRPGPSIYILMVLFYTLKRSHVYFRIKVSQDIEGKGIKPLGTILFHFFTRHVYTNKREFETRYPCLSQMISEALNWSVPKEDFGGTTVCANSAP